MTCLTMKGNGTVENIKNLIKKNILNCGGKCKIVNEINHQYSNYSVVMITFKKFYGKTINEAYLNVLITGANDIVVVDASATDGVNNMLSRFSWGQDEDFIYVLTNTLQSLMFE